MQFLVIAGAAGGQEVLHMQTRAIGRRTSFRLLLRDEFVALALVDLVTGVIHDHPALGSIKQIADSNAHRRTLGSWRTGAAWWRRALPTSEQASHLEDDLATAEIVAGEQSVRRLLIVIISVLAAGRRHAFWPFRIAQPPAANA